VIIDIDTGYIPRIALGVDSPNDNQIHHFASPRIERGEHSHVFQLLCYDVIRDDIR
jgi:hypothetical protein